MAKIQKKAEQTLASRIKAYEDALKTASRPSHFNKPGSMKPNR